MLYFGLIDEKISTSEKDLPVLAAVYSKKGLRDFLIKMFR